MDRLTTVLKNFARSHPNRPAVIDDKTELTYKELFERVNQWSRFLTEKGVDSGHSVMIFMNNQVGYLEVFLALETINAKIIPVNVHYQQSEIEYLMELNQNAYMITENSFTSLVKESFQGRRNSLIFIEDVYETDLNKYSKCEVPKEEFTSPLLFFTSGTTGKPKGIVVSPEAFTLQIPAEYYRDTTEYNLIIRPLFFRSHLTLAISIIQEGKTLVLTTSKSQEYIWILTHKYNIHQIISGPSDLTSLVDWLEESNEEMPGSLEVVMTTGNPTSYLLKKRLMEQMPDTSFIDFYGTSEVGGISSIDETEWLDKHGSVGIPSFFVDCRVVDENGEEVPKGEIGEISICSRYTMDEYLNNPALNKKTFYGNLVRTGDYGYLDDDGYLFLSGRKQDEINHGGFSFYSAEVEDFLIRYSGVKEVVVLGKKNDTFGQQPIAYVVIDKRLNKHKVMKEIKRMCEEQLPSFKRPVFWHFLSEIPLTSARKPDRFKLLSLTEKTSEVLF
ncbi:class I adenylate-forming enzyme family protein [Metabacillus elymi]|uniref:Acyl--CoA ligase n=1 Tax=Metabacillus elymi TaxID=2745198 RepID=A0ABX6S3G3_9BACI|nr:class I adenylate-forming enzyme family protein [Metabacillus sp. KUDC1714]QNF28372.1 acyl--CoA ligase [Metabacillus sp. KUDC1714]